MSEACEPTQRAFFAAVPDQSTCDRIASVAAAAHLAPTSRRVLRSNYHMTLAFLGEVAESRLGLVEELGAAQRIEPFCIRFDAYDYWPKPAVVVAAARTVPAPLEQLWQHLHAALAVHGWALEPKRLRPHITLARGVGQPPVLPAIAAFDWVVREFSLMLSQRSGGESAYTVVATWSLLDKRGHR